MTVATLRLDLRFLRCHSSRDKRRQLRAIMAKLHKHFNVSLADAEDQGPSDTAVLVAAAVGRSRREARETLERVADAVSAYPRAEVVSHAYTEV